LEGIELTLFLNLLKVVENYEVVFIFNPLMSKLLFEAITNKIATIYGMLISRDIIGYYLKSGDINCR